MIIIAVLAAALIKVRQDLEATSADLATLAGALEMVESEHLQPLEPRGQGDQRPVRRDPGRVPGIARKAKIVAERRPR